MRYNPPPNWPQPAPGWNPPAGWVPDPEWGPAPEGWELWVPEPAGDRFRSGVALGAIVGLVLGGVLTFAFTRGGSVDNKPASVITSVGASAKPATKYRPLTKSDFTVTIKTLTKECFGSAGCVVTFRAEMGVNDLSVVDPASRMEVTYEVTGCDDAQVGTFTTRGENYTGGGTGHCQTPVAPRLSAHVTDATPVG